VTGCPASLITSRRLYCGLGALLFFLLARPTAVAQAPSPRVPPTFEAGIEAINLNVSVTDTQNHYVTDLTKQNFVIFEDGVRQDIAIFTHENLPISLVLMIDTSSSMDRKLPIARAAAGRFIRTLRPQDSAQVVQFNDRTSVLQDFTSDQTALLRAVEKTEASGPTALHNSLYVSLKELSRQKTTGELRRRAIVLLSDGEDTASLVTDDQVLELARKTEIGIYAISLRADFVPDKKGQEFSQAQYYLTALTRDTGGQIYFPASLSELDAVYDRIAEELRTQYGIGYVSSNRRRDGKWRRIVLRIHGREGLQVRHKIGYYGPKR
jgi:Ca-activated chloride channel family protein